MNRILKRQGYHLLSYIAIGVLLYFTAVKLPGHSRLWGLSTSQWILFSWILAGIFQMWILLFWRLELYYGRISAWMGRSGFSIFRLGFILLGLGRLLPLIPISLSTAHTMSVSLYVTIPIIVATTPFIIWGLYSVVFYFGINRAFGADHFDPAYRSGTLEKRGIFKYIPNSMYVVVLLVLYHPGLLWQSLPGLITAAAHHAFVWTHYFCTEKPDMGVIYGQDS